MSENLHRQRFVKKFLDVEATVDSGNDYSDTSEHDSDQGAYFKNMIVPHN